MAKGSRREEVLRAAFAGWAESYYSNTSLAVVAEELGVSKAALYRHFRSKEELISSMEATYLADFRAEVLDPLAGAVPAGAVPADVAPQADTVPQADRALEQGAVPQADRALEQGGGPQAGAGGSLERFADAYFGALFDFFRRRPEYYVFFIVHVLREAVLRKPGFRQLLAEHELLMRRGLAELPPAAAEETSRYMTLFAVYWLLEVYRIDDGSEGEGMCGRFGGFEIPSGDSAEDASRRRGIVRGAVEVFLHGFLRTEPLTDEVMERVERIGWITEEEMLRPDRIFSAIEEVVAEAGFEGATVERIAERIGMTKSSLYFYFKNKDQMFGEAVEREQMHLASIMKGRFRFLETASEKIYAFFVMIASYVINNPTQLTVINWLRYRNVDVQPPKRSFDRLENGLDFLLEPMRRREVEPPRDSLVSLALFPHFLVTREVLDRSLEKQSDEEQRRALRQLFRLFEGGVAAQRGETRGIEPGGEIG